MDKFPFTDDMVFKDLWSGFLNLTREEQFAYLHEQWARQDEIRQRNTDHINWKKEGKIASHNLPGQLKKKEPIPRRSTGKAI